MPKGSRLVQRRAPIGKAAVHINVGAGRQQLNHLCVPTLDGSKEGREHDRSRPEEEVAHCGHVTQDARAQHLGGEPLMLMVLMVG